MLPISAAVDTHGHNDDGEAYDDDVDFDLPELPVLPLARPGERRGAQRSDDPVSGPTQSPPPLGGPSFTAADPDNDPVSLERGQEHAPGVPVTPDEERFTRELAARLAAGMLANPSKGDSTVKDAVALFDQLLFEMRHYSRVAADLQAGGYAGEERRRRDAHVDWFRYDKGQKPEPSAPSAATPVEAAPFTPTPAAKPSPAQPRPSSDAPAGPYRRSGDSASDAA
ncbi:MAG: hypothetical protein JWM25_269 [Thermoleophilia bacterium]|nr:hypothetical protein [Thermoleophilia bacterium]MCZ4495686.1 hypothetical protein [Thermoleophilia bacterium]